MVSPQPAINVLGILILEPVTTFTDLMVSAACFYAFSRLGRQKFSNRALNYFRWYFFSMGMATLIGGLIGHGFLYAFGFAWKLPGWITSMFSVALIERSAIESARPWLNPRLGKWLLRLNIIELLTVMTVTIYTLDFRFVEFHSGYGLVAIVLPLHLFIYYRQRNQGSRTVILAVLVAIMAALIFMNEIALDTWFNHFDISHTLMTVSALIFLKGALILGRETQRREPAGIS